MVGLGIRIVLVLALLLGTAQTAFAGGPDGWATVDLVQTAAAGDGATARGGSSGAATTESRKYKLDGARWLAGPTVAYRVLDAPAKEIAAAIEQAAEVLDPYITTRSFARDDKSTQVNPCTGEPNTVSWAPIDGPHGVLAETYLCVNKKTGEIGGFDIVFDSLDQWVIDADGNNLTYDILNVAVHEFGHVAGLDHVKNAADACLTMYFASGPEETQKRTLGWGDKIGLDKLYDTGDRTPGPGCGA